MSNVPGAVAKTTSAANREPVVTAEAVGLERVATTIGEAWAHQVVRALVADEREIVGAWPGTIFEAKMRVLAHLTHPLDVGVLADLARVATEAARRHWLAATKRAPAR